eukprot:Opistho-2@80361
MDVSVADVRESAHAAGSHSVTLLFTVDASAIKLTFDITRKDDPTDVANRLISNHNVPCYLEDAIASTLKRLLSELALRKMDDLIFAAADRNCVAEWAEAFYREHAKYLPTSTPSEADFPEAYHVLIHSTASETLVQLEQTYAMAVGELVSGRNMAVANLHARQEQQMDRLLKGIGATTTERDVNALSAKHLEDMQMLQATWASELTSLRDTQRRDYREFVLALAHEEKERHRKSAAVAASGGAESRPSPRPSVSHGREPLSPQTTRSGTGRDGDAPTPQKKGEMSTPPTMQKSNSQTSLGIGGAIGRLSWFRRSSSSEVRTTSPSSRHSDEGGRSSPALSAQANAAGNVAHPLSIREESMPMQEESFTVHLGTQLKTMHNLRLLCAQSIASLCAVTDPVQRVQTSLSLYSKALSGAVMLEDPPMDYGTGNLLEFARCCESSTDFHFPEFDVQLQQVQVALGNKPLVPGDFYVTRHSNIASFQVVFHLVVDKEVNSALLSTRSPLMLGLRGVLALASKYDVCHVTLPLLLTSLPSDATNDQWKLRRAELVLKCVKGFMMESSAFAAVDLRTITFLLPSDTSEGLFATFSAMVTNIFRMSTPLNLSASASTAAR